MNLPPPKKAMQHSSKKNQMICPVEAFNWLHRCVKVPLSGAFVPASVTLGRQSHRPSPLEARYWREGITEA